MTGKRLFILPSVMYWLTHQLISHRVCCPPACLPVCLIYQWRPGGRFSSPLCGCFIVSVFASFTPFSHTVTFLYQPHFSPLSHAHLRFLSHTLTYSPPSPRVSVRRRCLPPHMARRVPAASVWVVSFIPTWREAEKSYAALWWNRV